MSSNDLFNIVADVYAAYVKCSVLSHKRTDAAHIIPVITVLVATKAIDVRIENVMDCW